MAPLAYGSIGAAVKDLLSGGAKGGAFVLDNKVSYTGKTSTGLALTLTAVTKGAVVEPTLKASYASKSKAYSADVTYDAHGKVAVTTAVSDLLVPGVKATGSVTLPDPSTAKLALEYAFPYLTAKGTVALTSKPTIDLVASTGYKELVVGVEAGFDTAKSAVSKYNIAAGYHAADFQVAVSVLDKLKTVKVGVAHNVTKDTKVAAELVRKVAGGETTVSLAYAKTLPSGALAKFKLDNAGVLSALYETKLASGEKLASSIQVQTTDLSKPAKYGFALDLSA